MKRIELHISTIVMIIAVITLVVAGAILIFGGQPQEDKVWGQGDLPADWQEFFGKDNISRVNFVQMQVLNKQGQAMVELIKRVEKLEAARESAKKK